MEKIVKLNSVVVLNVDGTPVVGEIIDPKQKLNLGAGIQEISIDCILGQNICGKTIGDIVEYEVNCQKVTCKIKSVYDNDFEYFNCVGVGKVVEYNIDGYDYTSLLVSKKQAYNQNLDIDTVDIDTPLGSLLISKSADSKFEYDVLDNHHVCKINKIYFNVNEYNQMSKKKLK